jgi:hypothetical protein
MISYKKCINIYFSLVVVTCIYLVHYRPRQILHIVNPMHNFDLTQLSNYRQEVLVFSLVLVLVLMVMVMVMVPVSCIQALSRPHPFYILARVDNCLVSRILGIGSVECKFDLHLVLVLMVMVMVMVPKISELS